MTKRLLYYSLFLLSLLAIPASFSANHCRDLVLPVAGEEGCPLPPPGWLITTDITPTSISLLWEQAQVNIYYKVEGYDLTGGFALPTHYTSNNSLTYSGLSPGHEYQLSVSASRCPGGDFGTPLIITEKTIIIEDIVDLQSPCTPNIERSTGSGVEFSYCVFQSTAPNSPPYNNGFVGQMTYGGSTIQFGIALSGTNLHVGELNDYPDFSFQAINNNTAAEFRYKKGLNPSILLFTIDDLRLSTSADPASFNITFEGDYGNFLYCNSACAIERPSNDGTGIISMKTSSGSESRAVSGGVIQTQLSPNPFSESTTLRYELTEAGPVEISLYDATGRLVQTVEKTASREPGQYEATVSGTGLSDGVYFLQLTTAQNHKTFALVKRE